MGLPYKDWFCINFDGNSGYDDGFWYEGWEGHYELVKLNLQNPAVVDYLLECVKMWIEEFGIDGLRLDVAYSLDHNFMKRLRRYCEEIRPGFALIGEVLFGDYNLIVNDEMLHSCTNYECYKGLYSSFNSMNMFEIAHSLNRQYGPEQWCIYRGKHLMTFAGQPRRLPPGHDPDQQETHPAGLRAALRNAGASPASITEASGARKARKHRTTTTLCAPALRSRNRTN